MDFNLCSFQREMILRDHNRYIQMCPLLQQYCYFRYFQWEDIEIFLEREILNFLTREFILFPIHRIIGSLLIFRLLSLYTEILN